MHQRLKLSFRIAAAVAGILTLIAFAVFLLAASNSMYSQTKFASAYQEQSEDRANKCSVRISDLTLAQDDKDKEIADLQYRLGKAEAYQGVIPE